jgi:serine/threonine protein kinase
MDPTLEATRLTYEQVAQGGENHIQELYTPTVYQAASPSDLFAMTLYPPQENGRRIILARRQDAPQAYVLTRSPEDSINLYQKGTSRRPDWGRIYFAALCPAIGNNVFQVPQIPEEIVIKVLNKFAVEEYLQLHPLGENPLKELARMEEIGDNKHVLKHIEALEDEKYLYIVLPKGLYTLDKFVQRFTQEGRDIPPVRCHEIFCKIIQINNHLLRHGINHHDLSPDNLMFLTEDNLVLIDLALSNRIPINTNTGHRTLIAPPPVGTCIHGKPTWMDAVVYKGHEGYDGVAMDLYATGLILYYLSTSKPLYRRPSVHDDPDYNHFIHLEGLWLSSQQTVDNLHDLGMKSQSNQDFTVLSRIFELSALHLNMRPQLMHLLMNMLNENPALRFTLADVMESDYVNNFQG